MPLQQYSPMRQKWNQKPIDNYFKSESENTLKIFLKTRKVENKTDKSPNENPACTVVNKKTLRLFFNITFYIKRIYRHIKIYFT